MQEFFTGVPNDVIDYAFVLLLMITALTAAVVMIIQWRHVRQAQLEATVYQAELEAYLKKEMLERGMSGAEIKLVLEASASARPSASPSPTVEESAKGAAAGPGTNPEDFSKMWAEFGKNLAAFGKQWGGCGSWQRRRERCGASRG